MMRLLRDVVILLAAVLLLVALLRLAAWVALVLGLFIIGWFVVCELLVWHGVLERRDDDDDTAD